MERRFVAGAEGLDIGTAIKEEFDALMIAAQ